LEVSKQAAQNVDGESLKLRTLSELEVRKQYQIEFTKSFAAMGNSVLRRICGPMTTEV
jgi:hypothetical protein